jgi:hypothetical protein
LPEFAVVVITEIFARGAFPVIHKLADLREVVDPFHQGVEVIGHYAPGVEQEIFTCGGVLQALDRIFCEPCVVEETKTILGAGGYEVTAAAYTVRGWQADAFAAFHGVVSFRWKVRRLQLWGVRTGFVGGWVYHAPGVALGVEFAVVGCRGERKHPVPLRAGGEPPPLLWFEDYLAR